MKFQLACGDVMPGCPASFSESSQEALLVLVADHAAREHDLTVITPEVEAAITARIRLVE